MNQKQYFCSGFDFKNLHKGPSSLLGAAFLFRMSKELPYFKFEPNAWDSGNIQICSRESKGLFIDLCSIYWSRLGELPYALALQKHCNGNKAALQELIDNQIIGHIDGQIVIEFLDEQLSEFNETSEKRRFAANKRWNNASALHVQSKSNAIRGDKRRGEERRTEPERVFESKENAFESIRDDELFMDESHRTLTGRGWKSSDKIDVLAVLSAFLNGKADLTTPCKNVRQHFKNWIIREKIENLQTFAQVFKHSQNGRQKA